MDPYHQKLVETTVQFLQFMTSIFIILLSACGVVWFYYFTNKLTGTALKMRHLLLFAIPALFCCLGFTIIWHAYNKLISDLAASIMTNFIEFWFTWGHLGLLFTLAAMILSFCVVFPFVQKKARLLHSALLATALSLGFCFPSLAQDKPSSKPSLAIVLKSPALENISEGEYFEFLAALTKKFKEMQQFTVEVLDEKYLFWESPVRAAKAMMAYRPVDYMLYVALSKGTSSFFYSAKLIDPKTTAFLAEYDDMWKAQLESLDYAALELVSKVTYTSSGRVRVEITIITTPPHSDIYRGDERLGNSGENGFRRTCWWEKGVYWISVRKPGFSEISEELRVEKNPTTYEKAILLEKQ